MEKVISTETCYIRDQYGEQHLSTCQVIDTGIVINGKPVLGWDFIAAPGVVFARRGRTFQAPYPKQIKQPKCSEEFWRREKRVKVKPNWEIIRLKEDRAKLQSELKTLDRLVRQKADEFADACVMVKGLISTQKVWCNTTGYPDPRTKVKLDKWNRTKRSLQKEYECLQNSRTAMIRLSCKLHLECLSIRLKERT